MTERKRANTKLVAVPGAAITASEMTQQDLMVERLPQTRTFESPVKMGKAEIELVMYDPRPQEDLKSEFPVSLNKLLLQLANTRKDLHFNPSEVTVGIVTCGGLCPGLNDVVRSLTLCSIGSFQVKKVIGFRFGFWGLSSAGRGTAIELTHQTVAQINRQGGTILGSSRGPQKPSEMVDTLEQMGVNILFTVGGDGTQKGASSVYAEVKKRGLDISVFGIPKTIDNDLSFSHRTFGFETAVEQAVVAIRAAYSEASSHRFGIGIVKLMGRHSGFIAAHASVASGASHLCLIPEQPVSIEVILSLLKARFETSSYCVITVAEGFGQDWAVGSDKRDASGNKVLIDIGVILKDKIDKFMKSQKELYPEYTIKYIDPSYMIRACAPNSSDAGFCTNLSTFAVHEAMAGHTNCIIAQRYSNFILVPIRAATSIQRRVDTTGNLWRQVRETTVHSAADSKERLRKELTREMKCAQAKREHIIRELSKL
jgi:6-phosphofructokinase 1